MKTRLALVSFCFLGFVTINGQEDELAQSIKRGKDIYAENCITCHMGNGEGVPATFPPLAKADYLINNPVNGIRAIKFGLNERIMVNGKEFSNMMPNPGLDSDEIADVMNYILNSWGNNAEKKMVTQKMVEAEKE